MNAWKNVEESELLGTLNLEVYPNKPGERSELT